jgi:hypothetical protein
LRAANTSNFGFYFFSDCHFLCLPTVTYQV